MKYILSIIFCLLSFNVHAEEYLSITLNKSVYVTKDNFKAEITGLNEKSVQYLGLSVEVRQDNKWVEIRRDTGCPCMAKCKKKATEVPKGLTTIENWEFKNNKCNIAPPGTYRAVVTGNYVTTLDGNLILGSSREFQIK